MTPDGHFLTGQNLPGGQFSGDKDSGPDGDGLPSAEDLFSTRPAASPADIRAAVAAQLGQEFGSSPVPRRPGYPGIHELAEDLGLALWPGA